MPTSDQDLISVPAAARVKVDLDPARSAILSLVLLAESEQLSGLDDWLVRTGQTLTPEERWMNRVVAIGLHYAILPERRWASFPAYVDHLEGADPYELRDKLLRSYARIGARNGARNRGRSGEGDAERNCAVDTDAVLQDVGTYLDFLRECFCEVCEIDEELESRAYSYVVDPPAMRLLIVSHLREMWDKYLSAEWERQRPLLEDCVAAFRQIDLDQMSKVGAAETIIGRKLESAHWKEVLEKAERVFFAPSPHIGPYLRKFWTGESLVVLFGARLPEGAGFQSPALSRSEIIMRLDALSDDNRLRILKLVSEKGELRSQDIMAELELGQSTASRHLKQLSAVGHLSERRCNGAKCYDLNARQVEGTLQAISGFLLGNRAELAGRTGV